jgi:hypothetical protein
MAVIPYLHHVSSGVKVYFWAGDLLPQRLPRERNQTKVRASDGRIKVFDQGWYTGSAAKRTWVFKAKMDNAYNAAHSVSGYNYDDLTSFLETRCIYSKYRIYFKDCLGNINIVRVMDWDLGIEDEGGYYEIILVLEEDYGTP